MLIAINTKETNDEDKTSFYTKFVSIVESITVGVNIDFHVGVNDTQTVAAALFVNLSRALLPGADNGASTSMLTYLLILCSLTYLTAGVVHARLLKIKSTGIFRKTPHKER